MSVLFRSKVDHIAERVNVQMRKTSNDHPPRIPETHRAGCARTRRRWRTAGWQRATRSTRKTVSWTATSRNRNPVLCAAAPQLRDCILAHKVQAFIGNETAVRGLAGEEPRITCFLQKPAWGPTRSSLSYQQPAGCWWGGCLCCDPVRVWWCSSEGVQAVSPLYRFSPHGGVCWGGPWGMRHGRIRTRHGIAASFALPSTVLTFRPVTGIARGHSRRRP